MHEISTRITLDHSVRIRIRILRGHTRTQVQLLSTRHISTGAAARSLCYECVGISALEVLPGSLEVKLDWGAKIVLNLNCCW